jgi:hypothetical protein
MRVQEHQSRAVVTSPELDPALLAFVKCHITSFAKWDVLRSLSEQVGYWTDGTELAREINRPADKVRDAIDELLAEGIVERAGPPDAPLYRLPDGEPTTVVVGRLIAKVTRSQELRRIVVAHILHAAVA